MRTIIALPTKILRGGIDVRLRVLDVTLGQHGTISNQCSLSHLHRIAGHADESLYEILRRIFGPLEHDDVAASRLTKARQAFVCERDLGAIHELVDEEEVAHLERVLHAAAGDLERFDEEGSDQREQYDGYGEDLRPPQTKSSPER